MEDLFPDISKLGEKIRPLKERPALPKGTEIPGEVVRAWNAKETELSSDIRSWPYFAAMFPKPENDAVAAAEWEASKARYQRDLQADVDRADDEKAREEARKAANRARQQDEIDARVASWKRRYLAAGGTEAQFQAALPDMLEKWRQEEALKAEPLNFRADGVELFG